MTQKKSLRVTGNFQCHGEKKSTGLTSVLFFFFLLYKPVTEQTALRASNLSGLKHLVFEVLLSTFSLTALSFIDLKVVHLRSLASPRTDGFKPSYLSG